MAIKFKKEQINSVGLAILLCVNPLSWLFPVDDIIVFFSLLSLLIVLINNSIPTFVNIKLLLIIGVLFLFVSSFSFFLIESSDFYLYLFSFFAFGVTGILYSSATFNYTAFYKTIFIIAVLSLPGILVIDNQDFTTMKEATGYWMGVSQGALRLILALFLVIPFLKSKTLKIVVFSIIIFYLNFYFKYGTRGSILALLTFFLLIYLEKKEMLRTYMFIIVGLIGLIFSLFFVDFLVFLQGVFESIGLSIKAIDKVLRLDETGAGITNGRLELWKNALNGIFSNPILGNGVASYEYKYGIYPHNFLLQILYEGGVVYFLLFLIVFLRFFKILTSRNYNSEEKKFVMYLFTAGIMELIFSNTYWRNVFFWFFIGFVISMKPQKKACVV